MAWSFGDSFDLYAAIGDAINGYWDSNPSGNGGFSVGRFSGSRALSPGASASANLLKSSGVNDAVHHIVVSFAQASTISGANNGGWFTLYDGTTAQCSVVFRSDGAILLQSGAFSGTTLATYTGAFTVINTWYAFEFEISINNATGVFNVRKNGNTVNDFSATALNTRGGTANNYANKIGVGNGSGSVTLTFDDLFWRSDASSVAWLGDIRCFTRMPASDQSLTFSHVPSAFPLLTAPPSGNANLTANQARYAPFTPSFSGTIGSVTMPVAVASTANIKCAIYSSSVGLPATSLGSATPISAPAIGNATFTFGTPVSVTAGTQYFVAFDPDTTSGQVSSSALSTGFVWSAATYASFPTNNPTVTSNQPPPSLSVNITPATTANFAFVAEAQQDGLTTYVYDSNPGDADFYGVSSISSTPATVYATTIRAYAQKSDAGTRTMAVQLKSGAATVASPTLVLTTSGFFWAWRTDLTDPNTSAAWTATAVNNAQIGPKVIA